jgi:hypothetical protein
MVGNNSNTNGTEAKARGLIFPEREAKLKKEVRDLSLVPKPSSQ